MKLPEGITDFNELAYLTSRAGNCRTMTERRRARSLCGEIRAKKSLATS